MTDRDRPLVSVIIPVYGTEDFLDCCIRSVLRQSYTNLEVLLVDDGSPDRCPEMCDAYARADSRVRVFHQENAGQGAARNLALDHFRGDYLLFVDSDDYILGDMVEELVDAAISDGSDLVLCGRRLVDPVRSRDYRHHATRVRYDSALLMKEYLTGESIGSAPHAKLIAREHFAALRFPNVRAREDLAILHELFAGVRQATFVPEPYYVQRVRAGSVEQSPFNAAKLDTAAIADGLFEYVCAHYPDMVEDARFGRARILAQLMQEMRSHRAVGTYPQEYRAIRQQLRDELPRLAAAFPEEQIAYITQAAEDGPAFARLCLWSDVAGRAKYALGAIVGPARALSDRLRRDPSTDDRAPLH